MRSLVEYGLSNAAAAAALALVALLVGAVVRRPAVRHALWVLVLLRLLVPPLWTVGWSTPALEIAETSGSMAAEVPLVIEEPEEPEVVDAAEILPTETSLPTVEVAPTAAAAPQEPPAPFDWAPVYLAATIVWLGGTAIVLGRSVWRVARFRRALSDLEPADDGVQAEAASLAAALGLRSAPPVLVVPGRMWPSLWMAGRQARILFPAGLLPLLSDEERAAVLAHELAHLRRGDPWVRWLEVVACGVFWWNPLLPWVRRRLRQAEEECCDRLVADVVGRRAYATALVETAAFLDGADPVPSPALACGAGPVHNLQRRVTMIMRATCPPRLTRLGLAAVTAVGGLALAFGPAVAQEPPPRKDPVREERREKARDDEERARDRARGEEERVRERVRDDVRPKEVERSRDRLETPEIDKARADARAAREAARAAMARAEEAERRVAEMEGRRGVVERERRGGAPEPRMDLSRLPKERLSDAPPMRRFAPEDGKRDLEQMRDQLEEMRRMLESMREEMKRGRGPGGPLRSAEPTPTAPPPPLAPPAPPVKSK